MNATVSTKRGWKSGSRRGRGRRSLLSGSTSNRSSASTTPSASIPIFDLKPREERDYKEFYPDLDDEKPLKVFVIEGDEESANTRYNEFNEFHKSKITETYMRWDSSKNGLIRNTLTIMDRFEVLYDMDEQDLSFIKLVNETRDALNQNRLTNEILEIIFTFFEKEWYLLEKILPPKSKPVELLNNEEFINKATAYTSIYGSDDGTGGRPEEDQCCAVCNESECDNSNAIVFCDGCDIAVHQECYGVVFIPEGQWLCRRCLISRKNKSPCLFCPSTTGAFKQTDNGSWGHVICALWINELYFANPIYMEPIEGLELVPKSRWKLICYICKQKIGDQNYICE
ncbi:hypothetical protein PACTADRAFT_48230 [Pachysolen tannophilus NRRL Y-2460]|uniref:PHD-type domain-containing protein n=1 Tax=Pachysolen tannophilus NRRL Y-2460 TaxID=669874 RepID=A0A1E4U3A7_PACTA|nr:hypothetical protein PACTADRAFT_48230 [Pachysolen tannophilus NRRL Y-2460]